MLVEATLCPARRVRRPAPATRRTPRGGRSSRTPRHGLVGSALEADFELLKGCALRCASGPTNGPDVLFGCAFSMAHTDTPISELFMAVDLCLSGHEGC